MSLTQEDKTKAAYYAKGVYDIEEVIKSQRHYHTWEHISYMLDQLAGCSDEVYLAVLFHDIIYDAQSKCNEEDSVKSFEAYYAREHQLYWNVNTNRVCELIMATKEHVFTNDIEKNSLIKADLSILFADPDYFIRYENGIYKEYGSLPRAIYIPVRVSVLLKLQEEMIESGQFKSTELARMEENISTLVNSLQNESL